MLSESRERLSANKSVRGSLAIYCFTIKLKKQQPTFALVDQSILQSFRRYYILETTWENANIDVDKIYRYRHTIRINTSCNTRF